MTWRKKTTPGAKIVKLVNAQLAVPYTAYIMAIC